MQSRPRCFSCGSLDLTSFYEQRQIPVNNCMLLNSRAEAISFPRGDLRLAFCSSCGFIQNVLFDAERLEYDGVYEYSQGFSARFNQFQAELVQRLVTQYDLKGKSILEIGCGEGHFLFDLARATGSKALAMDPVFAPDRTRRTWPGKSSAYATCSTSATPTSQPTSSPAGTRWSTSSP